MWLLTKYKETPKSLQLYILLSFVSFLFDLAREFSAANGQSLVGYCIFLGYCVIAGGLLLLIVYGKRGSLDVAIFWSLVTLLGWIIGMVYATNHYPTDLPKPPDIPNLLFLSSKILVSISQIILLCDRHAIEYAAEFSYGRNSIQRIVRQIVSRARALKDTHTDQSCAPVSYACVFCQSQEEFDAFSKEARQMGVVADETPSGPLFVVKAIPTVSGELRVVKVRRPDPTRPERGYADFAVDDYAKFKQTHLSKSGFKLLERPEFEMIELMDSSFNVRAYFSHPPVTEHPTICKALGGAAH